VDRDISRLTEFPGFQTIDAKEHLSHLSANERQCSEYPKRIRFVCIYCVRAYTHTYNITQPEDHLASSRLASHIRSVPSRVFWIERLASV